MWTHRWRSWDPGENSNTIQISPRWGHWPTDCSHFLGNPCAQMSPPTGHYWRQAARRWGRTDAWSAMTIRPAALATSMSVVAGSPRAASGVAPDSYFITSFAVDSDYLHYWGCTLHSERVVVIVASQTHPIVVLRPLGLALFCQHLLAHCI